MKNNFALYIRLQIELILEDTNIKDIKVQFYGCHAIQIN